MTKEQKIEWLERAGDEELIEQLRRSAVVMAKDGSIAFQIEAHEDYELVKAELMKRLARR